MLLQSSADDPRRSDRGGSKYDPLRVHEADGGDGGADGDDDATQQQEILDHEPLVQPRRPTSS